MLTNCKNCGAPLKSTKCEYCGTEYVDEYQIGIVQMQIDELKRQQINLGLQISQGKINAEIMKCCCASFKQ